MSVYLDMCMSWPVVMPFIKLLREGPPGANPVAADAAWH